MKERFYLLDSEKSGGVHLLVRQLGRQLRPNLGKVLIHRDAGKDKRMGGWARWRMEKQLRFACNADSPR